MFSAKKRKIVDERRVFQKIEQKSFFLSRREENRFA